MRQERGDDMLTTQQVIDEYEVSASTLYRLRTRGILKAQEGSGLLTRPHEYKYKREDIEAAIVLMRESRRPRQAASVA